jgi:hypothetical protein
MGRDPDPADIDRATAGPTAIGPRRLTAPVSRVPRQALAALAAAATLAVGACQSAPPPTELSDPRAILAAAATTTTAAKTVRIDATVDGTVALDLIGIGAASSIELTGTTVSADLDLDDGDSRVTFSAPGLLGLTGELVALDGTSYLKTTLTGPLYQVQPIGGDLPAPSGAVRATVLQDVTDLLSNPALDPVKADDAECGSTTCYRVEIALSAADLAALGAADLEAPAGLPVPIPLPDLSAATVDLTVLVAKDTTRLAGLTANADLGVAGTVILELTFSKWDEAVSISAPPPDQLAPGS